MGVSALADHVGILQQFVTRFGEIRLFSTSAAVVTYPAPLYNVIGSTDDPKVPGYSSWTSLLQGKPQIGPDILPALLGQPDLLVVQAF